MDNHHAGEPHVAYPVFYDPSRVRGAILKGVAALLLLVLLALAASAVWTRLDQPSLPAVALPEPPPVMAADTRMTAGPAVSEGWQRIQPQPDDPGPVPPEKGASGAAPLAFGFMINWDEAAINSLRRHRDSLDVVIPQWLSYSDSRMLIEDDPGSRERVVDLARGTGGRLRIMPLVHNMSRGAWNSEAFAAALAIPADRRSMIDQLVDYVETREFMGVSVDFEQLAASSLPDYYAFVEELAGKLHGLGRQLSVCVPFDDAACDYARLAAAADYVIVMAYDEHWTGGAAGPVAGAPWLASRVEAFRVAIPAGKFVLGLGNYALDWSGAPPAAVLSVEGAFDRARQAGAEVATDPGSLNPLFRYRAADGRPHEVWFLDAVTAFNAAVLYAPLRPAGYAVWRLGLEDPAIWECLGRPVALDRAAARRLTRIRPQQVLYDGQGEVLRLSARQAEGGRTLWLDPETGLIRAERFDRLPSSYRSTRYGGGGRRIALTFDDGPDPAYTPAVLSILRDQGVKATFFVVGVNGERHPDLLRREAAEGHEIGVHTFTHPDLSRITPRQLAGELAASQRVLERALGRHSLLFRPPYGRDINTADPDNVATLEQVTDLGYLTVAMRLDTADWTNPGVEDMIDSVLEQAEDGRQIMVMHDSGGDRSATLQALPVILAELKKRGYAFVTVSQLLGLAPRQVMPPISKIETTRSRVNAAGAGLAKGGLRFIKWIFVSGLVLGIARMLLIGMGALVQRRRWRLRRRLPAPALSLSVIVPAYNESKVVVATVRSLLASEGAGGFDVIVVDDGSTDDTYRHAAEAFAGEPRVRVCTKPNGGKSTALNHGLLQTRSDIVIMLDADTLFRPDAIRRLMAHFADPAVGAVAGNVKVGNRVNVLTRWQALEYITSQSLDRRALTVINCNNVVPGAIGAWRRDLVMRVGMFNHRTLAEDGDLTLCICRLGYQIDYDDAAIALTEAPDTLRGFMRQRFRWMFGTFQVSAKHLSALFNRRHPWLGFVGMPNLLLFQVFFPLLAPFMDMVVLGSAVALGYSRWHEASLNTIGLWQFILYYLLFLTVDALSASLAFVLERNEDRRLLAWVPFQRVFYRMMMYVVAVKAIWAALTGRAVGWGTIARKATVAPVTACRQEASTP